MSVTDLRVVIEENADRLVGQLEAQPVLVRVIDPLGDEKRHDVLHGRRVARVVALHLSHAGLQSTMHLHALRHEADLLVVRAEDAAEPLPESRQLRQFPHEPAGNLGLLLLKALLRAIQQMLLLELLLLLSLNRLLLITRDTGRVGMNETLLPYLSKMQCAR